MVVIRSNRTNSILKLVCEISFDDTASSMFNKQEQNSVRIASVGSYRLTERSRSLAIIVSALLCRK